MVSSLGVAVIAMPSILFHQLCVYIKLLSPTNQKDSFPTETLLLYLYLVDNVPSAAVSIVILGDSVYIEK